MPLATPAVARDCSAEEPIFCQLIIRNSSPKPGISFSATRSSASGVTSRPVTPVPPVLITTSTAGSSIQAWSFAAIRSASSVTSARAASWWPAPVRRSTSRSPERSSAGVRLSETVSTAILSA